MTSVRIATILLVLSACLTSACAQPVVTRARAERSIDLQTDYQLGIGDKLRVIVYNEESLSGEFQVNAAGTISYPLIGEVPTINKTTSEVSANIQKLLADGYLRDPKVSVEVITYRPYFILGEIKLPGQYPYSNGLTVVNAVATAQGYTPRAGKKVAFIRRAGEAQEKPYKLTDDLRVYPGDTIRLAERFF